MSDINFDDLVPTTQAGTPIKPTDIDFEDLVPQKIDGPSKVESALRGAAQGLSFGFADEITAGVESALTPKTYEQSVIESRNNFNKAQESNPLTYGAADIAGSIIPVAVGTALSGGTATLPMLAGMGAAAGGLRGAGDADNMGDVPLEVAKGAAVGGVLGSTGKVLGGAGRVVENKVGPFVANRMTDLGEGLASRNTPIVGPLANNMVKSLTDRYVSQGVAPDVAEKMAYRLAGRMGSAAGEFSGLTGGLGMAAAGADIAAPAVGKGLQGLGNAMGGKSVAGMTSAATSNVPEGEAVVGDLPAGKAFQAAQGTKYQSVLQNAQGRSKEALEATLWSLSQDAEFRKLLNK